MSIPTFRCEFFTSLTALLVLLNIATIIKCSAEQNGKATIYSDSLSGKKTATGEPYNKEAMTAASPTLPLGTKVLVKNKKTGQSAVLRINDRQGKGDGRVIDLSKAAAKRLNVKGTAPVAVKTISN